MSVFGWISIGVIISMWLGVYFYGRHINRHYGRYESRPGEFNRPEQD